VLADQLWKVSELCWYAGCY